MDHHTRRLYTEWQRCLSRAEALRWETLYANPLRTGVLADMAGLAQFSDLLASWDGAVEGCRVAAERYALAAWPAETH